MSETLHLFVCLHLTGAILKARAWHCELNIIFRGLLQFQIITYLLCFIFCFTRLSSLVVSKFNFGTAHDISIWAVFVVLRRAFIAPPIVILIAKCVPYCCFCVCALELIVERQYLQWFTNLLAKPVHKLHPGIRETKIYAQQI